MCVIRVVYVYVAVHLNTNMIDTRRVFYRFDCDRAQSFPHEPHGKLAEDHSLRRRQSGLPSVVATQMRQRQKAKMISNDSFSLYVHVLAYGMREMSRS